MRKKHNLQKESGQLMKKLSMGLLALLPILAWYAIPFPVGLGYAMVLFLSVYTIVLRQFKINIFPSTFWIVCVYVCFIWSYRHDMELWTLFPPGGWIFFIFLLAIVWGVLTFDLQLLRKYMRWVVLTAAVLFWIQFGLKLLYGANVICFVPNLTGSFTYEGLSYTELVARQLKGSRPCSIFLEPSYMAYYFVTYLGIAWFGGKLKEKWYSKEIIFIIVTLLALQSGSGMVALAILIGVKIFKIYWTASIRRRLTLLITVLPVIGLSIYFYTESEMGQKMLSRSQELSTEQTSGYDRVVGGYVMFDHLQKDQQIFGISDARDIFGTEKSDGNKRFYVNGFQMMLLTFGYVGTGLYLLFYISLFRKVELYARISIIILLVMSLLESNYLNAYMMLLTIIPCADYYYRKKAKRKIYKLVET